MTENIRPRRHPVPPRFERPSPIAFMLWLSAALLFIWSFQSTGFSLSRFIDGLPSMGRLVSEMLPPSTERLAAISYSLLETFQMALVGTVIGVLISVPLAVLATRHLSPHPLVYHAARSLIAFFRTVPDLIWALLFVVTVGLGPFAGALAIVIDKIGFCGRFFAEAMEETDKGPREALSALGATRTGIIFSAIVPMAMPSFIATSLFSLEKAVRGSVILGLVGAGGIGVELKVAFDLFAYSTVATIIICIFLLVLIVEQVSNWVRRKLI